MLRTTARRSTAGPVLPARATTRPSSARSNDHGFATAEAAVAMPALLAVLALALGVIVSVGGQLKCVDAARAGARVAARGDSDAAVRTAAFALAPRGAQVTIRHHGGLVEVEVRARILSTKFLPAVPVQARAAAEEEDR